MHKLLLLSDDVVLTGSRAGGYSTDASDWDYAVQEGSELHATLEGARSDGIAVLVTNEAYIGGGENTRNVYGVYLYRGMHFIVCRDLQLHVAVQEYILKHYPGFGRLDKGSRKRVWQMIYDLIAPIKRGEVPSIE